MSLVSFLKESVHLDVHWLLLKWVRFTWIRSGWAGSFEFVWVLFLCHHSRFTGESTHAVWLLFLFSVLQICPLHLPALCPPGACWVGAPLVFLTQKAALMVDKRILPSPTGPQGTFNTTIKVFYSFCPICTLVIVLAWGFSALLNTEVHRKPVSNMLNGAVVCFLQFCRKLKSQIGSTSFRLDSNEVE